MREDEVDFALEDEWKDEAAPEVKMTRPKIGHWRAYSEFCRETYESLGEGEKWLVASPNECLEGAEAVVEKRRGLCGIGYQEFWALDDGKVVGILMYRERPNEYQREWGGHVMVVVRPSMRNMGYGTDILRKAYKGAEKVISDADIIMTVDVKNKAAWHMVRRAAFDKVRILQPKRKGAPKMIYQFFVHKKRSAKV